MSLAGVRSFRGDEYQFQVALDWTLRLLTDPDVLSVQVESLGIVGEDPPSVDDIVVRLDDRTVYVQAKKNHPKRSTWSFGDEKLRAELVKARDQLEADTNGEAWIYSQSPFGELEQLVDEIEYYPDYAAFEQDVPGTLSSALERFASVVERDLPRAFDLARRVRTKRTLDFEDWERAVLRDLRVRFARPEDVADLLFRLIDRRHARLGGAPLADPGAPITRYELEELLRNRGHVETPVRPEADLLASFARASQRGRTWKRDVDGRRFERPEVGEIAEALEAGTRSVVVTSGPGGGKTCVLLDLVDQLEMDDAWAVLFIKGDQYEGAQTASDLIDRGLPEDLVGRASRLSVRRRVVVVVDALDVLSLQRSSGTLSLFLNLIDELSTVEGVAVVAACRDFDLAYAPELRDRTWGLRVRVGLLPEPTVREVVEGWRVNWDALDEGLRKQLQIPQHLRLYGQLVRGGVTDVAAGPYALHDRFLDVVVEGAEGLGAEAMDALYNTADRLQRERRLTLPLSAFPGESTVAERLLSTEVFIEPRLGMLAFSHQELLDCVAVRGAVRRGDTLLGYLRGRAPLPFVRPTARTFLFMLRAQDPEVFRRQAREAMADEDLAYHLRRLIAESLAEVAPEADDIRLLRFLMQRYPDLFERFANRVQDLSWLAVVLELLSGVHGTPIAERWTTRLLMLLNRWASSASAEVLGAWKTALTERWPGAEAAAWSAARAIRAALEGIPEGEELPAVAGDIIRILFEVPDPHGQAHYELPQLVQAWIEAVDGDDDLIRVVLELDLEADPNDRTAATDFKGSFLEDRLATSDELMEWAFGALQHEATRDRFPQWSDLLNATSYRGRHSRGMMAMEDERAALVGPFERALVRRAERRDDWWLEHEADFLKHDDWGFQYLSLQAYASSPEHYARSIASLIANPEMLGRSSFSSELRELAYAAYIHLTDDEREAHQDAVLAAHEPDEDDSTWRARRTYGHLVWVPAMWRTLASQDFIQKWERCFAPWRPQAAISSNGGVVPPPFGSNHLLELGDDGIVQLAFHYGVEDRHETDGEGYPIGGWDQVVSVYRDAASRAPSRMAAVLPRLIDAEVPPPYLDAVVDGLGAFLHYRFGNTSSSGWKPVEEHATGENVGRHLLRLLERFGDRGVRSGYSQAPTWKTPGSPWLSEHTAAGAARGCAEVLTAPDDIARLTLILVRLLRSDSPEQGENRSASTDALNSVRGEAALAAMNIAGELLADGRPLPPLLFPLLLRFASDPVAGVRWSIVNGLPYVTQFDAHLGWSLAQLALSEPDAEVWTLAERLFYYNYYHHFERVAPYLDRLDRTHLAPEAYGRISMLSALAGHLDPESLLEALPKQPDGVWKGVVQVLVANLPHDSSRETCLHALRRVLSSPNLPPAAVQAIVIGLGDNVRPFVPRDVVERLIDLRDEDDRFRWTRIVEWVEAESVQDPTSAAAVLTKLADAVEESSRRGFYGSSDELARALNAVLREADESNDPEFIQTAVGLQDAFSRRGLFDSDAMLEAAARR